MEATVAAVDLPPDLDAVLARRIERWREAFAAAGMDVPDLDDLPGDARRVLACSDFVGTACERDPALLLDLVESGDLARDYRLGGSGEPDEMAGRVAAAIGGRDDDALHAALRRLRRREMVRIAWRDIGGLAGLDRTVAETSSLAEAAVEQTLHRLHERLREQLGTPESSDGEPQEMIVYALGKLGAGELNFSSDIDLIFAFPGPGNTRGGRRSLSNEQYFLRLGRLLIQSLDSRTADGIVFRVDMRLRPFGTSGPLAMAIGAMEDYYQTHGRDWERYALIRARPIAGDREVADGLLERLQPFVYRRYLDFGTLESLRSMKRLIEDEVRRKGLENDVKLGRGGIREIEFTGQAFQMVRGGRLRELRTRSILEVYARLRALGLLPGFAVEELSGAYRFLRDTEHRLQQVDDQQTHTLPDDALTRARIAAGMGFSDWPGFARVLEEHRRCVHGHFEQVFGTTEEVEAIETDPLAAILNDGLADDDGVALLATAGFADPAGTWTRLERFLQTHAIRLIDQRGRERLARLLPDLLRATARQGDGAETLGRVLGVIETVARRSVYIALLCERPLALSQLVQLCAASPWIARHIARHPLLLDELLDSRTLYAPLDRAALARDLATRLANASPGDMEEEMLALRQYKHANVLRVAAADVAKAIPLMVVSDHLTEIAEAALRAALDLAWRDFTERHGVPPGDEHRPFAVIAYGKLGGIELGYGSDLDLVFVHDSADPRAMTGGPKPVAAQTFYHRLAQRLIHYLTTTTPEGVLYEIDARLRPNGAKGELVATMSGLSSYLRSEAWTWEHQALVRARFVAGDAELGVRFAELRRSVLLAERDAEELREEVRAMRERMMRAHGSRDGAEFDLKQDRGGMADIEFMVQYAALRWGSRLGDYLSYTDNIRLLEGMARAGVIAAEDARLLTDAYRAYRARVHSLSLQERRERVDAGELADYRTGVSRLWQELMQG